jgi:hypothetical protein
MGGHIPGYSATTACVHHLQQLPRYFDTMSVDQHMHARWLDACMHMLVRTPGKGTTGWQAGGSSRYYGGGTGDRVGRGTNGWLTNVGGDGQANLTWVAG